MVKVIRPGKRIKQHGPVSTISTAPVAIGNSIRGASADIRSLPDGARVVGRDFGFSLLGTSASVSNWELVGGMPITPCVLPSTILRNYAQMFAHFKVNKFMVHYITASATSQTGDIMFYYEHDRMSPAPDYSSTSFLPFVLSDSNTVIGPQWTNHTLVVNPVKEFKSTAFGLNADLNTDAIGTVYVFSKTSSTTSPGYILIDYDITFKGMAVNPRAGQLPVARGQFNPISMGVTSVTPTAGTTALANLVVQGTGVGGLATTIPTGATSGDIYKFVISAAASNLNTWTNVTLSNLMVMPTAVDVPVTIDDGFTVYARWSDIVVGGGDVPTFRLYPTLTAAITSGSSCLYGVSAAGVTFTLVGVIALVASAGGSYLQSSY